MRRAAAILALLCTAPQALPIGRRLRRTDIASPAPLPSRSLLVIGFLGAWEDFDNPKRSVRKLALRLRDSHLPGVFVETADNHSRNTIRRYLRAALDANHDGRLQPAETRNAAIILYGQSFGGAAVVKLARELNRWNVPVRLTVQVDSIGRNDGVLPPNVRRAANLYQRDPGPIRGRPRIRAADPSKTEILFNQRFTYLFRDVEMSDYPAITRTAPLSHWKMDNDPVVWAEVEALIRAEIARWQSEFPGTGNR
jgi:hypothetical protein